MRQYNFRFFLSDREMFFDLFFFFQSIWYLRQDQAIANLNSWRPLHRSAAHVGEIEKKPFKLLMCHAAYMLPIFFNSWQNCNITTEQPMNQSNVWPIMTNWLKKLFVQLNFITEYMIWNETKQIKFIRGKLSENYFDTGRVDWKWRRNHLVSVLIQMWISC